MKHYRIKNYDTAGYIVQKRCCLFFWQTISIYKDNDYGILGFRKIFITIEDARLYVYEQIEKKERKKRAKHIEYI